MAVSRTTVLEKVSVEASLASGRAVSLVDLLPILVSGGVFVDEVVDGRVLTLAGGERKDQSPSEEDSDGSDGSGLLKLS